MFKGTGTALITPFKSDLSVDYEALIKIIYYMSFRWICLFLVIWHPLYLNCQPDQAAVVD